jgi:transcriptional regulator with XRE-family HTH domain
VTKGIKLGHEPPEPIGARIRRLRRAAGFTSREDLANAIGNPSVSAAVIKNIEAGRKADMSVVHLLEIAYALGVSPVVLLLDFSHPNQEATIAGLGPNFSGATNNDLDDWLTEPAAYAPLAFGTDDYHELARELRIASMAAKATVESVDQARVNMQKHGRNNVQIENHLEELRIRAAQSEQILRMTVRTAESLGMDLTEGN